VNHSLPATSNASSLALARTHNTSLVRLLGGVEKPVPAYGAVGYDGARGSAKVAENWARRGFKGVKAKIGYPDVKEDLEAIRAIRSAVGDDVAIMVDYSQCLTPADAVQRVHVLDGLGLAWVEEPTLAHDYEGHAIDAHASDYVMLDVMKIGGATGWMRAASLAEIHGIPVSNHLWPEISWQLLCLTATAHWLEYADWWNVILSNPPRVECGIAIPQDAAGSGVEWNEDGVHRCMA
jgi:mandelate racemase